ncbi:MAG: hypothetical protein IPK60_24275 [Sandaracinaceae bacterium]|nr:hypothetical protein [Sandaracinaceae bacterium]
MRDDVRRALPVASFAFGIGASLAYVAQRIVERLRSAPIDPTLLVFTIHTSFYWRVLTATFWGGVFGIIAYAIAHRLSDEQQGRCYRALSRAIVPIALILAYCSWRFP